MAVQPGSGIVLTRKILFIVIAAICFAVDLVLAVFKVAAPAALTEGLFYGGLLAFVLAFL